MAYNSDDGGGSVGGGLGGWRRLRGEENVDGRVTATTSVLLPSPICEDGQWTQHGIPCFCTYSKD
jgi:hypothetical protein